MNPILIPVIPTGVRPSVLGWSNGVEEPAVRLMRQTACKRMALLVPIAVFLWRVRRKLWKPAGEIQWRSINPAQAHDSILITVTRERRCRASLDRTGGNARPYMAIFDYLHF